MAPATPEIHVFAMFRVDPQSAAWRWVHCLTFPVETLSQLHFPRPYQWMKYAIGVVVGAHGELSSSIDSQQDVVDRDDLPSETIQLYYHITDEERQRMFPIDLDMGRRTVTSSLSSFSTRRVEFCDEVIERDGLCVLTGAGDHGCQAAHLIAHAKGDDYIATYTRHRSRVENDIIEEVDDVRNGVLLNLMAHNSFGEYIAFLMTPNFAMTTADIHPDLPPREQCCTAHRLDPRPLHRFDFGDPALSSGHRVRMPPDGSDDRSNWPPDILFDAAYAYAVVLNFPAQGLRDAIPQWKSTFYPGGATSAIQADYHAIIQERAERKQKDKQKDEHNQRRKRRSERAEDTLDTWDILMILPYIAMEPERVKQFWRETKEKKQKTERTRLEDEVVSWRKDVIDASP